MCHVVAVYHDSTNTSRTYDRALDIFTDTASATPMLWLGEFSLMLQHPPNLHMPSTLTSYMAMPPGSRFSQQAAQVTKRLAAYPLSVLSAFQPTYTAGRCIDYALGNARLLEVFEMRQLFQIAALASDHTVIALTLQAQMPPKHHFQSSTTSQTNPMPLPIRTTCPYNPMTPSSAFAYLAMSFAICIPPTPPTPSSWMPCYLAPAWLQPLRWVPTA